MEKMIFNPASEMNHYSENHGSTFPVENLYKSPTTYYGGTESTGSKRHVARGALRTLSGLAAVPILILGSQTFFAGFAGVVAGLSATPYLLEAIVGTLSSLITTSSLGVGALALWGGGKCLKFAFGKH